MKMEKEQRVSLWVVISKDLAGEFLVLSLAIAVCCLGTGCLGANGVGNAVSDTLGMAASLLRPEIILAAYSPVSRQADLRWEAVPGAVRYRVYSSASGTPTTGIEPLLETASTACSLTITATPTRVIVTGLDSNAREGAPSNLITIGN